MEKAKGGGGPAARKGRRQAAHWTGDALPLAQAWTVQKTVCASRTLEPGSFLSADDVSCKSFGAQDISIAEPWHLAL